MGVALREMDLSASGIGINNLRDNLVVWRAKLRRMLNYYKKKSDSEDLALVLCSFPSTSVYIYSATQLTFEQWLMEAETIMSQCYQAGYQYKGML
jgi:hypothetical protein